MTHIGRFARRGVFATAVLCLGCSNSTPPELGFGPWLILVAGSTIRAIDLDSGVVFWVMPLDGAVEGVATGSEPHRVFVSVKRSGGERELLSIDLCGRVIDWRLAMFGAGGPNQINEIGLSTGEVVAVPPRADRIYLWRSWKGDTLGIASLDLDQLTPTAFSGPWNVAAGGIVPLWPGRSNEALAVVASRDQNGSRRGSKIYLLDPASLTVSDSIDVSDLGAQGEVWSVTALTETGTILVGGATWLATYDTGLGELVRSVARPASGSVNVSPDGATVVLTDVGTWPDFPGSGLLHLFDSELSPVGTIDVSTPLGGSPGGPTATVTMTVAFADDGRTAYILAGTASRGPLYPTQTTRIIAVDLETRTVVRVYDLGGHELGWLSYLTRRCQ